MQWRQLKIFAGQPMFLFLLVLTIASTTGLSGWRTLINNFAVEKANFTGGDIGIVQSVREIPGFLALFTIFFIRFIKEHRFASLTIILMGISIAVTGFFPSLWGIAITTLLMSTGFHYYETANQSLSLQYFEKEKAPLVLGYQRSIAALTAIATGLFIWLLSRVFNLDFLTIFSVLGILVAGLGIWTLFRDPTEKDIVPQKKTLLLKKRYWLYYTLTFLAGARRQIFVAFAIFLLVQRFDFTLQQISILFVVNNAINFFIYPYIGKFIMRFGERKLLTLEYFSLIFIFLAYAFTTSSLLVIFLYIMDHILFNFALAIKTYFQKIAAPEDIAPSMAMGFTINHIAAVIIPFTGGLLWDYNYQLPFFFGAFIAAVSLLFVRFIKPVREIKVEG
jgi:predicted MFS family arabinose efflux permease